MAETKESSEPKTDEGTIFQCPHCGESLEQCSVHMSVHSDDGDEGPSFGTIFYWTGTVLLIWFFIWLVSTGM